MDGEREKEEIIKYEKKGKVCEITLNRPERINAICIGFPERLKELVERANKDDEIHVIVVKGEGRGFCSGYDLREFAEQSGPKSGFQSMPWDPLVDYQNMRYWTDCFMSLFRSLKPTIAVVHGVGAIAGGSDIALCCDFILMTDSARIGYPPARVWGCPTTFMWVYRIGFEKAKRMLLTGDLIDGKTAKEWGLVLDSFSDLNSLLVYLDELLRRIASIPKNQLMMQKLVINQIMDNMGLNSTQTLSTLFDGIARHSPEGVQFKMNAEKLGFKKAVELRDNPPPLSKL